MRSRIGVLMFAVSTLIVVAFLVPMALLVQTLAQDRAMATAQQEARNVAILVTGLHEDASLAAAIQAATERAASRVSVRLPDGRVLGSQWAPLRDPNYGRAAAGESFAVLDAAGGHAFVPVVADDGTTVIRASLSPAQLRVGVDAAWAVIFGLGILLVACSLAVAWVSARRISRPLLRVADTAHRLRDGDLQARAPEGGPAEIAEVARALNRLADRTVDLLVSERRAVGDLAHRLRTPTTALRLDIEGVVDPEIRQRLAEHVLNLQGAIDHLVAEARRPMRDDMPAGCDASAVLRDRIAFWQPLAEDQRRALDIRLPHGPLLVGISASDLCDVLDVAVDNVFAHTDDGVGFRVELRALGDSAQLRISDEGPGYPAVSRGQKPGTSGVGLLIVRRLVRDAGGRLDVSSPGRAGATLTIELPLAR